MSGYSYDFYISGDVGDYDSLTGRHGDYLETENINFDDKNRVIEIACNFHKSSDIGRIVCSCGWIRDNILYRDSVINCPNCNKSLGYNNFEVYIEYKPLEKR